MDSRQHLYYAIGIMAYAVAKADGEIQEEEKEKLQEIINEDINHVIDFDYANIIFQLLEHDNESADGVYNWAINALTIGKHYLTDELKGKIKSILTKVAEAFPPTTAEENKVKNKFIKAIDKIGQINLPLK